MILLQHNMYANRWRRCRVFVASNERTEWNNNESVVFDVCDGVATNICREKTRKETKPCDNDFTSTTRLRKVFLLQLIIYRSFFHVMEY